MNEIEINLCTGKGIKFLSVKGLITEQITLPLYANALVNLSFPGSELVETSRLDFNKSKKNNPLGLFLTVQIYGLGEIASIKNTKYFIIK